MEMQEYIERKNEIYCLLLEFIENESQYQGNFQAYYQNIKSNLLINDESHYELKSLLFLISKISDNYHRTPNFDKKIEQILDTLLKDNKNVCMSVLTNSDVFDIFKDNKRILLFLFKNNLITIDEYILKYIQNKHDYLYFFYPEIKSFMSEEDKETIEKKINREKDENFTVNFEKKRLNGENESFLCSLIRDDLIKEFIVYINQTHLSVSSKIERSIFETNSLLIKEEPTLIEYAAFYGSIQIFQYLKYNKVQLKSNLWIYAIHSKNAELIHFLEEYCVDPPNNSFEDCFIESIKCHHNDIADYIKNKFKNQKYFSNNIIQSMIQYSNYTYFSVALKQNNSFYYLCKYNHLKIVDFLIQNRKKDIELKLIKFFDLIKSFY